MTIAEAYEMSVRLLREAAGADRDAPAEARVKARLIVDDLAGGRYAHLLQPGRELDAEQERQLREVLARVARGYPLSYLWGRCEFFGAEFRCDPRALIPRPETETLVEAAIARLRGRDEARLADLGTGTGCIAISLAAALPGATVWATDVSHDALELARANAARHGIAERIRFVPGAAGDWAGPLHEGCATGLDAVLSNPPYIAAAEIETLQPEIRDWEPSVALYGGEDGLACYREIARQCGALLAPGGFLMVELGAGQFTGVHDIFVAADWTVEPPLFDLSGTARVLVALRPVTR